MPHKKPVFLSSVMIGEYFALSLSSDKNRVLVNKGYILADCELFAVEVFPEILIYSENPRMPPDRKTIFVEEECNMVVFI